MRPPAPATPALFLLLFLIQVLNPAQAHSRSSSYSNWDLSQPPYQLSVRLSQYELTRLQLHPAEQAAYKTGIIEHIERNLSLFRGPQRCAFQQPHVEVLDPASGDGWITYRAQLICPTTDGEHWRIRSRLMLDAVKSHNHFLSVQAGNQQLQSVLTAADNEWSFDPGSHNTPAPSSWPAWVTLGIRHILSGWDHLAFVLGLLLLARKTTELAWLISGFTLAHSFTLAAATLGWLVVDEGAVESLIGLSIVLVATEFAWQRAAKPAWMPIAVVAALLGLNWFLPATLSGWLLPGMALIVACYFLSMQCSARPQRWRMLVAVQFGLIHGFGFAGILSQMGLPSEHVVSTLLGFNVGVELGQLAVIALLWPLIHYSGRYSDWLETAAMTGIAGLGSYYFVIRMMS